jgi:hypothetical protein
MPSRCMTSITRRVTSATESDPPAFTSIMATEAIDVTTLTAPSGARINLSDGDSALTPIAVCSSIWSFGRIMVPTNL